MTPRRVTLLLFAWNTVESNVTAAAGSWRGASMCRKCEMDHSNGAYITSLVLPFMIVGGINQREREFLSKHQHVVIVIDAARLVGWLALPVVANDGVATAQHNGSGSGA